MTTAHTFAKGNAAVETHTYKRAGKLEIKLDVHRGEIAPQAKGLQPTAVWIHGGALINGGREGISGRVKQMLLGAGYALVSIDYRLAPETKLPAIISDVEDAFSWLRQEGKKLSLNTDKLAVLGGSAGGYLTLTAGYRVKPRVSALVSFWGYGDLIGDWYSKPSPHPRHHRVKLSRKETLAQVDGPPIANSRDRKGNGGAFYQHCRQHGIWPKEVSGWDPHEQPEKFTPYMPVRNVDNDYPPTLLIHGTKDTDVPYQQSVMMVEQFKKHGVEHRFISIENGEHGLGGGDRQRINEAYSAALGWVKRFV